MSSTKEMKKNQKSKLIPAKSFSNQPPIVSITVPLLSRFVKDCITYEFDYPTISATRNYLDHVRQDAMTSGRFLYGWMKSSHSQWKNYCYVPPISTACKDVSKYNFKYFHLLCGINEIYFIRPYRYFKTSVPNPVQISAGHRTRSCILTGIFQGCHTCQFAVIPGHLSRGVDDEVEAGERTLGQIHATYEVVEINGEKWSSDIGLSSFDPNSNQAANYYSKVDIDGKTYRPRLASSSIIRNVVTGTEVWMSNRDCELKKGKLCIKYFTDSSCQLYNVMVIETLMGGEAISQRGDSGSIIFLPPDPDAGRVEVIGMVEGVLDDGLSSLTIANWFGRVLRQIFKEMPYDLRKPGIFGQDEGLPLGVDFAEGLGFYEDVAGQGYSGHLAEYQNLVVQSEKQSSPKAAAAVAAAAVRDTGYESAVPQKAAN